MTDAEPPRLEIDTTRTTDRNGKASQFFTRDSIARVLTWASEASPRESLIDDDGDWMYGRWKGQEGEIPDLLAECPAQHINLPPEGLLALGRGAATEYVDHLGV
jgi:hypothetical protein